MLKVEDCVKGAEVICINNSYNYSKPFSYYYSEWLKLGHIYTIRGFVLSSNPQKLGDPGIAVNEIVGKKPPWGVKNEYCFNIWRFKKLDKKDIQIFYDILSKPIDQKISENA